MEHDPLHKQLEVLETRVQEMIALTNRLKKDKAGLETRMNQKEREWNQAQEEREKVRLRIEKILGTINHLEDELNHPAMEKLAGE